MDATGEHDHCLRPGCGRKLTNPASRRAGYGPVCKRRIRQAVTSAVAKDEQLAKAVELIEDGGIVPVSRPGVFAAASSDGTTIYVVDVNAGTCTCPAGQHGRYCYHLAAAQILTAATLRRRAA